jgi:hypothetical protein
MLTCIAAVLKAAPKAGLSLPTKLIALSAVEQAWTTEESWRVVLVPG